MLEDQAAICQLAFEEARRAVGDQVGALDNLRGRAGTLLAVASLSTSLLGGIVLQGKAPHEWLSWAAIAAFLGVVAITLVLLLPRSRWRLNISATTIIEGTPKENIHETSPPRTGTWRFSLNAPTPGTRRGSIICTGGSSPRAACSAQRFFGGSSY
jgi:hypothetical protein